MKEKLKQYTALLLTAVMLVGLFPFSPASADTQSYVSNVIGPVRPAEPEETDETKAPTGPDEAGIRLSPLAPALAVGAFVLSLTGLIVSRALIRGRRRRKQQQIREGAEYAE